MDITERRAGFAAICREWVGTPYIRRGMIKGAGADCATLVLACLIEHGCVTDVDGDEDLRQVFSDDWFVHSAVEEYQFRVMRHARKLCECVGYRTSKIDTGCILLVRAAGSKRYNHAGLCVGWPRVVHAIAPAVEEIDASRHPMWMNHEIAVFDPFSKSPLTKC